jgi:hypothetical protein
METASGGERDNSSSDDRPVGRAKRSKSVCEEAAVAPAEAAAAAPAAAPAAAAAPAEAAAAAPAEAAAAAPTAGPAPAPTPLSAPAPAPPTVPPAPDQRGRLDGQCVEATTLDALHNAALALALSIHEPITRCKTNTNNNNTVYGFQYKCVQRHQAGTDSRRSSSGAACMFGVKLVIESQPVQLAPTSIVTVAPSLLPLAQQTSLQQTAPLPTPVSMISMQLSALVARLSELVVRLTAFAFSPTTPQPITQPMTQQLRQDARDHPMPVLAALMPVLAPLVSQFAQVSSELSSLTQLPEQQLAPGASPSLSSQEHPPLPGPQALQVEQVEQAEPAPAGASTKRRRRSRHLDPVESGSTYVARFTVTRDHSGHALNTPQSVSAVAALISTVTDKIDLADLDKAI